MVGKNVWGHLAFLFAGVKERKTLSTTLMVGKMYEDINISFTTVMVGKNV